MGENDGFLAVTQEMDIQQRLQVERGMLERGSSGAPALLALLRDTSADTDTRWRAAVALGKLGYGGAVDTLLAAAQDASWEVRHSAIWALAQLGDPRGFDRLRTVCTSGALDEQVNYIAAVGLARQFGDLGKAILENNLVHPNPTVRAWARAALANLHYP